MPPSFRPFQIVVAAALLASCAPSDDKLASLARAGAVQEDAPIKADVNIVITAPADRIWALLAQVDRWPSWQPDISKAALAGPLAPGARFTWTTGGTEVRSTLILIRPATAIAWTGEAFGLKAVHVWTLTPEPGGHVLVRTQESMDGFPTSLAYSSAKLAESDLRWLASLKRAAESSRTTCSRPPPTHWMPLERPAGA